MELQEKDSSINAEYEPNDGIITNEGDIKLQKHLQNGIPSTTVPPPTAGPTYVHTSGSNDCCCLWCWFCTDSHTDTAHYHNHSHHPDYSTSSGGCSSCDCNGCCDCSCGDCCGDCGDCCGECGDCCGVCGDCCGECGACCGECGDLCSCLCLCCT